MMTSLLDDRRLQVAEMTSTINIVMQLTTMHLKKHDMRY